jgi:hypothetical protein
VENQTRRSLREGIAAGLVAGMIFAVMEIAGAAMMGNPPLMPIRMFASVLLGKSALEGALGVAIVVGIIAHMVLSGAFGVVYGLVAGRLDPKTQTSFGRQSLLGMMFGLVVWLVNFQIIARVLYPWFLETPQVLQAMMHALFFGLPLALVYTASERKAVGHAPAPQS